MRPGANRRDQTLIWLQWLKNTWASMRPGANRRDQSLHEVKADRDPETRFNEARRESPGSGRIVLGF